MSLEARRLSNASDARLLDLASLAMVGALLASLLLYKTGGRGWEVLTVGLLCVPAYLVTFRHRDWALLAGVVGVALGAATGWALHLSGSSAWTMSWLSLATVAAVWAPWPVLERDAARAMLWLLAVAPIGVLLFANLELDVSWLVELVTPARLGFEVGTNELGILASVSVLSTLLLRISRDSLPRYALQALMLVIAGSTGTRTVLPVVAAMGFLWWRRRRDGAVWRGHLGEALPWALYLVSAAAPLFLRTASRLSEGANRLTSGRWDIWREYADVAATAPWSGLGLGHTRALSDGILRTDQVPHNVPLELVVEIGIPGMVIALLGLTVAVAAHTRRIRGPHRWLLRTPLMVLLPTLALWDAPLRKAELMLPILGFSAAAASLTTPTDRSDDHDPVGRGS